MTHEYDTLLYEAEYRVVSRHDELKTHQINDRDSRQANETSFVIERKGEWWESSVSKTSPSENTGLTIKWNPGKQAHEVLNETGEVLASFNKEQGGKAAAEEMAAEKQKAA